MSKPPNAEVSCLACIVMNLARRSHSKIRDNSQVNCTGLLWPTKENTHGINVFNTPMWWNVRNWGMNVTMVGIMSFANAIVNSFALYLMLMLRGEVEHFHIIGM